MTDMIDRVGDLMRHVAAEAILPRFRALRQGDVQEKFPGEVVTAADHAAERLLTAALPGLLPGSVVFGEEAVSADPGLRAALATEPLLWLVDPLDGTANFVAGKSVFAVMVALVEQGETVAGWMLDPLTGRMAVAETGSGALYDGARVQTATDVPALQDMRGAVFTRFLPAPLHARLEAHGPRFGEILPGLRCAGHEYPAIVRGVEQFSLFWRAEPWDHAAGTLFLTEAGGHVARPDGSPYLPCDGRAGLLVAQNRGVWDRVAAELLA